MTPMARALATLRDRGLPHDITERRIPGCKVTKDLFGFADLIYLNGNYTVAVQVTSGSHHAARRKKILAEPNAVQWVKGVHRRIQVWSYSKLVSGWTLREEEIRMEDFA